MKKTETLFEEVRETLLKDIGEDDYLQHFRCPECGESTVDIYGECWTCGRINILDPDCDRISEKELEMLRGIMERYEGPDL